MEHTNLTEEIDADETKKENQKGDVQNVSQDVSVNLGFNESRVGLGGIEDVQQ